MPVFKCKMCGGDLQIGEKDTIAQCSYCGSQQTLPRLDDDKRANLYDRANHFRRGSDFDKAAAIYESILNEDHTDAEAYWSLVLCKYGVEYVEDPKTHRRIPTCNRAQFTAVFADADYKQAIANADGAQKALYEQEAKAIDSIQKGILEISAKEEPFDVFVCYKESDNNGRRTPDSVLAQDLYYQLKQEGFKVFFSRITLEDKLGSAYEPYIFAALNSSKVMVAVGTKPEHFNSPWVRNEWSRYLALMKNGAQKTLIPAYKDMDPYDLPEEFSHLQAQDMSKLGFMQDLVRGIKKILGNDAKKPASTVVVASVAGGNSEALLRRAFICLEDEEWLKADDLLEQVLNIEPENSKAYTGKLMVELQVRSESKLATCEATLESSSNYQKALRFADEKMKATLQGYNDAILDRLETERKEKIYSNLMAKRSALKAEKDFSEMAEVFKSLGGYKDAEAQAADCMRLAEQARQARIRAEEEARIRAEQQRLEKERIAAEKRLEAERQTEIRRIAAEKRRAKMKKILKIMIPSAAALIAFLILLNTVIIPAGKYSRAQGYIEEKKYTEAISIFTELGDYKDSTDKINSTKYTQAEELLSERKYAEAILVYSELGIYKDCNEKINSTKYTQAEELLKAKKYAEAISIFTEIGDYKDSADKINATKYTQAVELQREKKYAEAASIFFELGDYKDAKSQLSSLVENQPFLQIYTSAVGDTIVFGSFEQDNNNSNGKESIEWLVLEKQNNKVLLISKECLGAESYNKEYESITWKTCTLRSWLNSDFFSAAFTSEEQSKIAQTQVENHDYSEYDTVGGADTSDKVFILSIDEANRYLTSNNARVAKPTPYAVARNIYEGDNGNAPWWLRSPGHRDNRAAFVTETGSVNDDGGAVIAIDVAVRPALWVNL